jgi:glycerol-3-phosphate acyltransferase PlsX
MLRIAVDAMGGDHAPASEIEGALRAARELGVRVLLVGPTEALHAGLRRHGWSREPIELVHATEVIRMGDDVARAVRRKKDATIRVGMQMVRDGKADAFVSAGNTGAVVMTTALLLGTLSGVDRPALTMTLPTVNGAGTVLLDVGANADCKPAFLEQFAVMGALYAEKILKRKHPRVGLLSIGEEESKGNELVRETHKLLKSSFPNFIGNVEGKDLYTGEVDVVVCDGFTGNVVLKTSEGLIESLTTMLRYEMTRRLDTKAGALLVRPAFHAFKKRLDYDEHGGAPLLGARKTVIVCHGRSNAKAIFNAVRVAKEFHKRNVNHLIETELGRLRPAPPVKTGTI